ncbi:MAG TPA: cobyric acid synthase CobQ, partial [Allocoleopsis sp.]
RYKGLGLLPLRTVITGQKVARQRLVSSNYPQNGLPVSGYEIHQGRTQVMEGEGVELLFEDANLGVVDKSLSVWGTYLHGLFDNGPWRRAWLNRLRQQRGLKSLPTGISNYREQRETLLDALATQVESHLDLGPILP